VGKMRSLEGFTKVHLYRESVDMRKSINGLSVLVMEELGMSFETDALFVFVSRCGKKLKMLYWDRSGFALWYKRLEKQKFRWPKGHDDEVIAASAEELQKLLYGFDVFQKPHEFLQYSQIW
jgi:transposase